GGDFAFVSGSRIFASTLRGTDPLSLRQSTKHPDQIVRLQLGNEEYLAIGNVINDIDGSPLGRLFVLRSMASARRSLRDLEQLALLIWFIAILAGLVSTFALARRIVEPIRQLDKAASEVARSNYGYRLPVKGDDELGRLARTFNDMCESIQNAQSELVR